MREFYRWVAAAMFLVAFCSAVLLLLGGFADRPSYAGGLFPMLDPSFWRMGALFTVTTVLCIAASLCANAED